ncbi:MAG: SufE family protein [Candidatus Sericytochromatia bacterium]|nr:SufE family protein [Candidatus Sericytochromatia bacterium]
MIKLQSIDQIQDEIIEEFEEFSDWEEKYSYLIEQGVELPKIDANCKVKDNLVMGCQSQVWLIPDYDKKNQVMLFKADSDSMIVKGLISLLLRMYSEQKPEDILSTELYVFEQIGLKGHLSPSRANGLSAMIRDIKKFSFAFNNNSNN